MFVIINDFPAGKSGKGDKTVVFFLICEDGRLHLVTNYSSFIKRFIHIFISSSGFIYRLDTVTIVLEQLINHHCSIFQFDKIIYYTLFFAVMQKFFCANSDILGYYHLHPLLPFKIFSHSYFCIDQSVRLIPCTD